MSAAAAGVGLLALLVALPALVGARQGVSPRVLAGGHLVSLLGWGLLAVMWLGCVGASIGAWAAGIPAPGGWLPARTRARSVVAVGLLACRGGIGASGMACRALGRRGAAD